MPRLLLSGGDPAGRGESEAAAMAAEATRLGVPPAALLIEAEARTTVENMLRSRELLARADQLTEVRAVLLVSSWWHLRRARALAAEVFGPGVRLTCCAAGGEPNLVSREGLEFEWTLLSALGVKPN